MNSVFIPQTIVIIPVLLTKEFAVVAYQNYKGQVLGIRIDLIFIFNKVKQLLEKKQIKINFKVHIIINTHNYVLCLSLIITIFASANYR